jgi:hypothetical protein
VSHFKSSSVDRLKGNKVIWLNIKQCTVSKENNIAACECRSSMEDLPLMIRKHKHDCNKLVLIEEVLEAFWRLKAFPEDSSSPLNQDVWLISRFYKNQWKLRSGASKIMSSFIKKTKHKDYQKNIYIKISDKIYITLKLKIRKWKVIRRE